MKQYNFKWLSAGYCKHPEFVTLQGGTFKAVEYPSFFGLLLHPIHGVILYDTGYSEKFKEVTSYFPEKLYSFVTPVCCNNGEQAKEQLKKYGLSAQDVKYIIISHFHADHICGLGDFPQAQYIYNYKEFDSLMNKGKLSQIYNGFLSQLIPKDFLNRSISVESLNKLDVPLELKEFEASFDVFGDRTLLIIKVPGHTHGQMGLFFQNETGQNVFLVGDSVWDSRSITENRLPCILAQKYSQSSQDYLLTIQKLQKIKKEDVLIIPSHCKKFKGVFE